jgi:hypothetical protein
VESGQDRNASLNTLYRKHFREYVLASSTAILQYKMARRSQQRFEVEHSCGPGLPLPKSSFWFEAKLKCRSWTKTVSLEIACPLRTRA